MWPGCACVYMCVDGWMDDLDGTISGNGVTNNSGIESKWRIMRRRCVTNCFLLSASLASFGEDFWKWNLEEFEVIIICSRERKREIFARVIDV